MKRFLVLLFGFFLFSCSTTEEKPSDTETLIPPDAIVSSSGKIFRTGLIVPKGFTPMNVKSARQGLRGDLPSEFDLRLHHNIKAPEDQGSCGSCWAFSMSQTVQDAYLVQKKGIFDTSEQHILSCTKPREWTCNGGFFDYWRHMNTLGGVVGSEWPYSGTDESCRPNLNHKLRIQSWHYTPGGETPSIEEIKAAIYRYGTISVGVAADSAFSDYRGGVFEGSGSTQLNHAVNLVGWSDQGGYWILKNTWGQWGEQGYMRIKYGANGVGAWANYVVFGDDDQPDPDPNPEPTPDPTPPPPPPNCQPQPYAETGFGDQVQVRKGYRVYLGTRPLPGHRYYWTAEPAFDGGAIPQAPKIVYRPRITKRLTLHAITRCGEATDSVLIHAVDRWEKDIRPEVEAN